MDFTFSAAAGLCGDELERRAAYFHLLSWSLPLILTITIMALAQVEADSVAGICFLSSSIYIRVIFLLLPITVVVIVGGFFFVRGKYIINVPLYTFFFFCEFSFLEFTEID